MEQDSRLLSRHILRLRIDIRHLYLPGEVQGQGPCPLRCWLRCWCGGGARVGAKAKARGWL